MKKFFLKISILSISLLIGSSCISAEKNKYPETVLKNENLKVTVYLPDAEKGYYRSIRFDWAGMIKQAEHKGHTYFGELKGCGKHHNPKVHDHGVGPCEEFGMNVPVNWDDVKEGEAFMKVAVGLLEKKSGKKKKYWFPTKYKVVKLFPWENEIKDNAVVSSQQGECPGGWKYDYVKTVSIDKTAPVLKIHHKLKNTGTKPIKTDLYSHNMFIIDGKPIGSKYQVILPFRPKLPSKRPQRAVWKGNELKLQTEVLKGSFWAQADGFSKDKKDNAFTVAVDGVSLHGATDYPLHEYCVYAEKTGLCPEPFILINIKPGETAEWTTTLTFKAE